MEKDMDKVIRDPKIHWGLKTLYIILGSGVLVGLCTSHYGLLETREHLVYQERREEMRIQEVRETSDKRLKEAEMKYNHSHVSSIIIARNALIMKLDVVRKENQILNDNLHEVSLNVNDLKVKREQDISIAVQRKEKELSAFFQEERELKKTQYDDMLRRKDQEIAVLEREKKELQRSLFRHELFYDLYEIFRNPFWGFRIIAVFIIFLFGPILLFQGLYYCCLLWKCFQLNRGPVNLGKTVTIGDKKYRELPVEGDKIKAGSEIRFYCQGNVCKTVLDENDKMGSYFSQPVTSKEKVRLQLVEKKKKAATFSFSYPFKVEIKEV